MSEAGKRDPVLQEETTDAEQDARKKDMLTAGNEPEQEKEPKKEEETEPEGEAKKEEEPEQEKEPKKEEETEPAGEEKQEEEIEPAEGGTKASGKKKRGKKKRGKKKALLVTLCTLLVLIAISVLGTIAVNCYMVFSEGSRIRELDQWKSDAGKGIDCILVLGCSVHPDGTPSRMLQDRLDAVIRLYQASPQKILVSGDHEGPYYNEVGVMKRYLVEAGIPSEDIFSDHYGVSTYDSIYRAFHVFSVRRVTIVTQKYHIYRALHLAKCFGMDADGYVTEDIEYEGQSDRDMREIFARDKDFLFGIIKPKPDSPMDPVSLDESGDLTDVRTEKGSPEDQ